MQGPKKLQKWKIDQNTWNLTHKWAMKKLHCKISCMPSKSPAATGSFVLSVNKMWYTQIWIWKYKIFPSNEPKPARNTMHGW